MPAVSFSVQNLPFTEPMLAVWAQLVSLAGSKLEKQRMKKSLSRGLTGTETAERHNTNVIDLMMSHITHKHKNKKDSRLVKSGIMPWHYAFVLMINDTVSHLFFTNNDHDKGFKLWRTL